MEWGQGEEWDGAKEGNRVGPWKMRTGVAYLFNASKGPPLYLLIYFSKIK